MKESAEEDFASVLIQDALAAIERNESADTQLSRRDLVRTLFASSEGLLWLFREHVVEAAKDTEKLTSSEAIALCEEIHFVTDRGFISTQRRHTPLTASIRLCARIAERLDTDLKFSFNEPGWQDFRAFISVRNRVTHPKRSIDLAISAEEATVCMAAFFWVTEVAVTGMEAANRARRKHLVDFRRVFESLKAGDPAMIELYRQALLNDDRS